MFYVATNTRKIISITQLFITLLSKYIEDSLAQFILNIRLVEHIGTNKIVQIADFWQPLINHQTTPFNIVKRTPLSFEMLSYILTTIDTNNCTNFGVPVIFYHHLIIAISHVLYIIRVQQRCFSGPIVQWRSHRFLIPVTWVRFPVGPTIVFLLFKKKETITCLANVMFFFFFFSKHVYCLALISIQ